ncbi:MAG TPA: VOC family protein [Actinomycetota bacterium]|nr:VOC family protein [Actinomycetota bacterium]
MDQRISLITLGVADVAASKAFYERLGWTATLDLEDTVFFQAGGMALGLWGRDELAADARIEDPGGWGGVTLSLNVRSAREVDTVLEQARDAGARISREPGPTDWGGYNAVFVDPDGHTWEIAHNPGFPLGSDGGLTIPSES